MAAKTETLKIGNVAGHHFAGKSDLRVAYHVTRNNRDGSISHGYFVKRKWLSDMKAFEYCPTMGWAVEHWFEWE